MHRVPIRVDLVDFAQVQLADTGFHLAHVADHHPTRWSGRMNFLAVALADSGVSDMAFAVKVLK